MNAYEARELLFQSIEDYKEYIKTEAYYKRMKRHSIGSKEIIQRLKMR